MNNSIDAIIIVIYLIGILAIGVFSVKLKNMSSERYFLAGRGLKWPVIGAALFASNISTIHLVGLAASGFNEGLVWGNFEWLASITLILLALILSLTINATVNVITMIPAQIPNARILFLWRTQNGL